MKFLTINQTAEYLHLPRYAVRRMVLKGVVPGFYSASRFYCNVELFEKKLMEDAQNFKTENVWVES